MRIKFVQVNIYLGKFLDELVDFLTAEKPDLVSMQEVSTNNFNLFENKDVNLFEVLKKKLGMYGTYYGDVRLEGDPTSVFGNAVFSRFPVVNSNVVVLKTSRPIKVEELYGYHPELFEQTYKHLLDLEVNIDGKSTHIMSWHGAWTAPPHDTRETLRQATLVYDHLKRINGPFILGGDLNAIPTSKTVGLIESVAVNLMKGKGVEMTTNPKVHKIAPRGYLIDYIFTSRDIKLIQLDVPQITVSDHLPVVAELEI